MLRRRRRRHEFPSTDDFYISAIREQDFALTNVRDGIKEEVVPKEDGFSSYRPIAFLGPSRAEIPRQSCRVIKRGSITPSDIDTIILYEHEKNKVTSPQAHFNKLQGLVSERVRVSSLFQNAENPVICF